MPAKKKTGTLKNGNSAKGNTRGRPKGTPNKVTQTVRQALEESLNSGDGAVSFFENLKLTEPKVYAQVVTKLIPIQVQQEINAQQNINQTTKIVFEKFENDEDK